MAATHSFLYSASRTGHLTLVSEHPPRRMHNVFHSFFLSLSPSLSFSSMPKAKQNLKIEIKGQRYFEEIYFSLIMIGEYFSWREQHHGLCQEELAVNLGKRAAEKQTREGCLCTSKSVCTEGRRQSDIKKILLSTGDLGFVFI